MEFRELVNKRQSCRSYDGKPVPHDVLCRIAETACLSPSACNSQPWKLYLVDSEPKLSAMREYVRGPLRTSNAFAARVPAFIVITETEAKLMPGAEKLFGSTQYFAQMDVGMMTAHLVLAARDEGVESCILGMLDEPAIRALLDVPDTDRIRLAVALGYAEEGTPLRPKLRRPLGQSLVED